MSSPVRIGVGAGFSGDRLDAALPLVERGNIQYLIFETLAERTIALAQLERLRDPSSGFHPFLEERLRRVLVTCRQRGVKIVSNMGAANPEAAGRRALALATSLGLKGLKIAVVLGDDVLDQLRSTDVRVHETGQLVRGMPSLVSANAYLGAEPIREALESGADVVLTGRVADPSLVLAPLAHEHGWGSADWDRLGAGIAIGHLLECTTQVTGGYFADPGYKDVPGLANVGYPIAEVAADGTAIISKTPGSGGLVSTATCKEQLLYEVHDPAAYLTPDVAADFTGLSLSSAAQDRVHLQGGRGRPRPATLKVSVGYRDGWIGEGQVSYGGPGAVERARLAGEVVLDRLELLGVQPRETRVECMGIDSLYQDATPRLDAPYEARVRVAARTNTREEALMVAHEVDSLGLSGPSAGSIASMNVKEVLGVVSAFIPRDLVQTRVIMHQVPD
ncbi:MAG: acyclic terpene utilization AtuA family protein [Chloroflexota bacterium]